MRVYLHPPNALIALHCCRSCPGNIGNRERDAAIALADNKAVGSGQAEAIADDGLEDLRNGHWYSPAWLWLLMECAHGASALSPKPKQKSIRPRSAPFWLPARQSHSERWR